MDQLTRFADLLVEPSSQTWEAIVFPGEPRDFPDAAYLRVDPIDG